MKMKIRPLMCITEEQKGTKNGSLWDTTSNIYQLFPLGLKKHIDVREQKHLLGVQLLIIILLMTPKYLYFFNAKT